MNGELFGKEGASAALVPALSVAGLAAGAGWPPSIGRLVSGVLSNLIPGRRTQAA